MMVGLTKYVRPAWIILGGILILISIEMPFIVLEVDALFVFGVVLILKGI